MIAVGVPGAQGPGVWGALWVIVVLTVLMAAYLVGARRMIATGKRSEPATMRGERVPKAA